MNSQCKFRHHWSIPQPRFPYSVQNVGALAMFFIDVCTYICSMSAIFLLPVCLTYWPRKYTTCVDSHGDNSNKFEVDMTTHCWVIAFFADMLHDLVTLTFDLLTLNSCHTWQVTWPTLPPSLKTLRLELWFITFPIGYHWKCVCGHCTCTKSHDPWARGQKQLHFWNPRHRTVNPLQLRWLYDESSSSYLQNNAQFSVKKPYESLHMWKITWSVKGALNVLLQLFSMTSIYCIRLRKLSI